MNNPFRPRPPDARDPRRASGPQRDETGEEGRSSPFQHNGLWPHIKAESHHTPAANPIVGDVTDGHEGRRHKDKDLL